MSALKKRNANQQCRYMLQQITGHCIKDDCPSGAKQGVQIAKTLKITWPVEKRFLVPAPTTLLHEEDKTFCNQDFAKCNPVRSFSHVEKNVHLFGNKPLCIGNPSPPL
jgi:hypothetical protein